MSRKQLQGEKKLRGFALIKTRDPERMREIAAAGGKAAVACGKWHRFTTEQAKIAGALGGSRKKAPGVFGGSADPAAVAQEQRIQELASKREKMGL